MNTEITRRNLFRKIAAAIAVSAMVPCAGLFAKSDPVFEVVDYVTLARLNGDIRPESGVEIWNWHGQWFWYSASIYERMGDRFRLVHTVRWMGLHDLAYKHIADGDVGVLKSCFSDEMKTELARLRSEKPREIA